MGSAILYACHEQSLMGNDVLNGFAQYRTLFFIDPRKRLSNGRSPASCCQFENDSIPKLLIKGAKSHFSSVPKGKSISIASVPGAGHFMMLETPDATLTSIYTFLETTRLV